MHGTLNFYNFTAALDDWVGDNIVGRPGVLHIIPDDIYIDIIFTSWSGGATGGGFAYTRKSDPTSVEQQVSQLQPVTTQLHPAYPNPFNPQTNFTYRLVQDTKVTLSIVNMQGQVVRSIIRNEQQSAGQHIDSWDGTNDSGRHAPSGIYFLRLNTNKIVKTQKLMLVR